MSNYNYLKIDFYGQFNDDTIHKLTYPEPFKPMVTTRTPIAFAQEKESVLWLNPITDPRAIRTLFPMAKYAYKVHRDTNGTYFSLLTRYERDARQGYVAITVMIVAQYESLINGQMIFNLLNLLKTNVLDTNDITAEAVEQCLIASQMPTINVAPPRITQVQNRNQQAFRMYNSNEELYDIFQFPQQKEYDQYGEVFLVNKFWCNNTVPGVALLTSPIIKTYNVSKPANVICDSTTQTGNTLNITYKKPGFAPLSIPVTINGIDNQYVHYKGTDIIILTPDDLQFKQRVNIRVRINGYNYSDDSVRASVGGAPTQFSSLLNAYSADVTKEMLSEGDIKVSVNIDDPLLDPTGKSQQAAKIHKWLLTILSFVLGAVIASGITWFLMKDNGAETIKNKPLIEITDTTTASNETHDINYMKANMKWQLDSLKSVRYQNFAKAINDGNVDDFLTTVEALAKGNNTINELLPKIAEKVKQDRETAKGILKNPDANVNTIDLEAIFKELNTKINKAVDAHISNDVPTNTAATTSGTKQ